MLNFFKKLFSGSSHRTLVVEALNRAVEIFTSYGEKSFEDVMANGIRPIVDAVGLDMVTIYNKLKTNKEQFGQFYRWDKAAGGTIPINEALKILPPIPAVIEWIDTLSKGKCVIRRLDKMSEAEISFSNMFGIKSIVLMPIFTHGEFWGIIAFHDHTRERDFEDCIDLLYSVAHLCAGTVIRNEITRNSNESIKTIERQKKMADTLNKSAVIFVSQNEETFEAKMTAGLKLICDVANVDRLSIWRNFTAPDGLHVSQVYRWVKESGGTTKTLSSLKNISYAQLVPRWESLLANGETINGPVKFLPEADIMQSFGSVSVLVIPLFIKNVFWGFVLFDDHYNERYFEDDYIEIMRSTAFLCTNIFIRAEMENKIAEANEFNNTLLNSASISIIVYDEHTNVLDCNNAALNIFGCTKQYLTEHFYDLSPEYQPDGLKSKDKAAILMERTLKGETQVFEWMHISFTGEIIPCEVTLTRVNYKNTIGALGYVYDLRNIKKMEAIANEAQEMARAITEASPISYILFNEKMQAVDCNEATMRIFACTDKQFLLNNYWERFSPKEQPNGQNSFEELKIILNEVLTKGRFSFEWIHLTFDGELLPMENMLTSFIFKDKKFIISFKYDLRSREKLMDNIREQNQLLALQLEQQKLISDISKNFISDGDPYTLINEALGKLGSNLGVSRMSIFYMNYERADTHAVCQWYVDYNTPKLRYNRDFDLFNIIKTLFPKDLPEGIAAPTISCSDVTISPDENFRMLETIDVSSFIYAPLYVEGSLWGIISAEYCFAPHKWLDYEISFFAMVSSIIAGAIMRNIYDIKLKETLDKVTSLSKAKDEFLSKISHEIRTPMNAILGITEIQLQNETLPQATKEGLSIIYNSGDSLLRIINDLLDLSKIEARKLEIMPIKYEIASLISDTTQLNMMRIESKPIEFKLNVDENIPSELFGDELRIKQILNNILSNAFKYTNKGEVSMSVSAERNEGKDFDITLVFRVSDTGHGMTEEQVHKIFDEYSRFNLAGNRLIEGTGLGMTITRGLVELMKGDILVESELNKGSVFTVRLPQKSTGAKVLGNEMVENLQKFRISSSLQMKKMQIVRESMPYGRVLVVDDVESNLYVAERLLAPYELYLETAVSGFEAIEKIKSGKVYNIIFMDHMMPKMDGIETVKIIRDSGYTNPIVALTANAIAGQAEIFLNNGFDGFISKPIDILQLNNELNKFIRDKRITEAFVETHYVPKADATLYSIFARDAKKALPIFESTLKNIAFATDDDLHLFAIKAHAMKSALANIGETKFSHVAFMLEKAGKESDKNAIAQKTQELIDALKSIIEKDEMGKKSANKDENIAYLSEQLKIISDSCANYDAKTADIAVMNLKKMSWTKEIETLLDRISEYLLHSDFEDAIEQVRSFKIP